MAIARSKEIRKMADKDVAKKMAELRLELAKIRGSAAVGASVKNPGRAREIRRTIARMLTITNEKKKEKVQ